MALSVEAPPPPLQPHLDSLGERLELVGGEGDPRRALGDDGDDGDTSVSAHHRTVDLARVNALGRSQQVRGHHRTVDLARVNALREVTAGQRSPPDS